MPSFTTVLPCSDIDVTVHYEIIKDHGIKTELQMVLLEDGSEVPFREWWYEIKHPCSDGVVRRSMVAYFEGKVEDDFDGDTLEQFYAGIAEARNDERNER